MNYYREFVFLKNPRDASGSRAITNTFLRNSFKPNTKFSNCLDKKSIDFLKSLISKINFKNIKKEKFFLEIKNKLENNKNIKFFIPKIYFDKKLNNVIIIFTVPFYEEKSSNVIFKSFATCYHINNDIFSLGGIETMQSTVSIHAIHRFFQRSEKNTIIDLMENIFILNSVLITQHEVIIVNKENTFDAPSKQGTWLGFYEQETDQDFFTTIFKTFVSRKQLFEEDIQILNNREIVKQEKAHFLFASSVYNDYFLFNNKQLKNLKKVDHDYMSNLRIKINKLLNIEDILTEKNHQKNLKYINS